MRIGPSRRARRSLPDMEVASHAQEGGAAAAAFDAIAASFDETFDPWLSVAAQRTAVRAELMIYRRSDTLSPSLRALAKQSRKQERKTGLLRRKSSSQ